jgi:hypothetical protein
MRALGLGQGLAQHGEDDGHQEQLPAHPEDGRQKVQPQHEPRPDHAAQHTQIGPIPKVRARQLSRVTFGPRTKGQVAIGEHLLRAIW